VNVCQWDRNCPSAGRPATASNIDEKSQIQALERTQPLLPLRENIPERQTSDYERHGTATLFAALNVLTSEVIGECKEHYKAEDYRAFLKAVDNRCEEGKELHIIVDNYGTHKMKEVKNTLRAGWDDLRVISYRPIHHG
jgi:transposase